MGAQESGSLVRMLAETRAALLRILGLASRRDILALQARLDALLRERRRAPEATLARSAKSIEAGLKRVVGRLDQVQTQLGTRTRGLEGRLRQVERNVQALVRHEYLDQAALPFPQNVLAQRFHDLSQNEEDGITLALVKLVGAPTRRFVELGAGTNGGNSGFLAASCGWTGLMVDGSPARAKRLVARFGRFGVRALSAWITVDNVNQLVIDSDVRGEIDLFSLDIDGNDYWVWRQLDACSPRIAILEFNPAFGSTRAVTVRYDATFDRAKFKAVTPVFYGASLAALERLGLEKGYRLILVEPRGVNAYFLRDDVAPEIPAVSAAVAHPDPSMDTAPLFTRIADAHLPLVDLDDPGEPETSAPTLSGEGPR